MTSADALPGTCLSACMSSGEDSQADGTTGPIDFAALQTENAALRAENDRLRGLLGLDERAKDARPAWTPTLFAESESEKAGGAVTSSSTPEVKVALFRSLFAGRDDVHALRWENQQSGKAGWSPAVRGGWSNSRRADREHLPFTDEVAARHLAGEIHAGLYPLLRRDASVCICCARR